MSASRIKVPFGGRTPCVQSTQLTRNSSSSSSVLTQPESVFSSPNRIAPLFVIIQRNSLLLLLLVTELLWAPNRSEYSLQRSWVKQWATLGTERGYGKRDDDDDDDYAEEPLNKKLLVVHSDPAAATRWTKGGWWRARRRAALVAFDTNKGSDSGEI